MIPVKVSVNSDGEIEVLMIGGVDTKIGGFSVSVEEIEEYHLEITLGTETRFYTLGSRAYEVYVPNSLDGKTVVRYDGKRNVRIIVPNPVGISFPPMEKINDAEQTTVGKQDER